MTLATPFMRSLRNWPSSRVLGASAAVLALVLAVLWLLPGLQPRWQPPAAQHTDLSNILPALPALDGNSMATHWPQRQNQLLQLQERPLFVLGRKPPPPPPPPKPTNPQETDQWAKATVLGTFTAPSTSGAFIQLDGQPHRILQGQTLQGWELTRVQPHAIEIRQGSLTRELPVHKIDLTQGNAGAPAQAVRPAQPAGPNPFAVSTPRPTQEPAPKAVTPDPPPPQPQSRAVFGGTRADP